PGRAAELVEKIRPVGDQTAGSDEEALEVNRRQLVPCRKCDDQIAIMHRQGASGHDEPAIQWSRECVDFALDIVGVAYVYRGHIHSERWRYRLYGAEQANAARYGGVAHNCGSGDTRRDLLQ